MIEVIKKLNKPLGVFLLFIIASAFLIAGGLWWYSVQKNSSIKHWHDILASTAHLKVEQIIQWRNDRIKDAQIIVESPFFLAKVLEFISNKQGHNDKDIILRLNIILSRYDYDNIYLLDKQGNIVLSINNDYRGTINQSTLHLANKSLVTEKVIFSDFYWCEAHQKVHIDLIAPLVMGRSHKKEVLGSLVFMIDPEKFLFPLIQEWPTPSPTAETLLVKQEGDRVLFINTLRHQKAPPLTINLPLDSPQLPAASAIKGHQGIMEGRDYRDMPVLAVTKSIPGTNWYMVAKVDLPEVFSGLYREGRFISAGVFLLILLVGTSMGWTLTAQRKRHYQELFRMETERQALRDHFEYLLKYANDIILLVDDDLKLFEVNDRACEAYGYSREELLNLRAGDLRAPQTLDEMPELLERLDQGKGLIYETVQRRKDGTLFPVEISNRIIEVSGKKFFQAIIRDITERKQAEENLQNEKALSDNIINSLPGVFYCFNDQGRFLRWNQNFEKVTGYSSAEFAQMSPLDLFEDDDKTLIDQAIQKVFVEGENTAEANILLKDGRKVPYFFTGRRIDLSGVPCLIGLGIDISGRRRAEELVQSERDQAKQYLDIAGVALIALDRTGTITMINKKGCEILGYQEQEISGQNWFELCLPPAIIQETQEVFHQLMCGDIEPAGYYENPVVTKTGEQRLLAFHNTVIRDKSSQIIGTLSSGEDITEQRKLEEALRFSEDKYRSLFEHAVEGIFQSTPGGRYLNVNPVMAHMLGFESPQEMMKKITDIGEQLWIYPEKRQEMQQLLAEKGFLTDFEIQYRRRDGDTIWVSENIRLARSADGQEFYEGFVVDITSRKKAEEVIKLNEARLTSLVKIAHYDSQSIQDLLDFALDEAIALTGSKIGYIYFYDDNQKEFTLNTWSKEVMQECTITKPQTMYQLEKTGLWGEAVRQARPIIVNDFQAPHPLKKGYPEGHAQLYKYLTIPVFSGERIMAVVGVANKATDYDQADVRQLTLMMDAVWKIADRQQAEKELRLLNLELELRVEERTAQLEAANRELEAFSYSVSHDLRAPLRGIDGWSMAFLEDYGHSLDAKGREYLDRVRTETQHMGRLIDDLLSLSRVTRAVMHRENVNLSALVHVVATRLKETAPGRKVEFFIQEGLSVIGDPRLLEVALVNLLDNAWKFTSKRPEARIEFGAEKENGKLVFYVRDNGAGFDMTYAQKLFGAFQRLHKTSEFPGTGIGLATVQRILKRHGGRIWAEAAVGRGATFHFTVGEEP